MIGIYHGPPSPYAAVATKRVGEVAWARSWYSTKHSAGRWSSVVWFRWSALRVIGSLRSQRHVLQQFVNQHPDPRMYELAAFPLFRGLPEEWRKRNEAAGIGVF